MRKQHQVTNQFISSGFSTSYYPDVISATNKRNSRTTSFSCLSRNGFSLIQSEALGGMHFSEPLTDFVLLEKTCYGLPPLHSATIFKDKLSGEQIFGLVKVASGYSDIWKLALLVAAVACIHILVPRSRTLSAFVVEMTHTTKKTNQ